VTRARRPFLVLGVLAAVPAAVLATVWWAADTFASRAEPPMASPGASVDISPATAGTPVFSTRRAPRTLGVDLAIPALRFQLDPVLSSLDEMSCAAVRVGGLDAGSHGANTPLLPASNVKLLTAAAALDVLGDDFRYETALHGTIDGTRVVGDLFLVGGGDPLLAVASYPSTQRFAPEPRTPVEDLVQTLVTAGVTEVAGAVVGVETRYDDERFVETWGDGIRVTEAGPLGALMVNDGSVTGEPLKPADPAVAAAAEFTRVLRAAGIVVVGEPRSGALPDGVALIGSVESAAFTDIVAELLTNSDNNTAELVVKEIAVASGKPGTRVAGLDVVARWIADSDLPVEGITVVDGSGLDRGNRLTCGFLVDLLDVVDLDGSFGAGLPVAGVSGTMKPWFAGTPLDGRLRAKTGTLTSAKAFSGYLPTTTGEKITYAIVLNGEATLACGTAVCPPFEALARALATYPGGAPPPNLLGPLPVVTGVGG
jgi:serine-type D-Ala-D-Ala carboxypeptidase/endopeptidase (penicillin-binding protein 4)